MAGDVSPVAMFFLFFVFVFLKKKLNFLKNYPNILPLTEPNFAIGLGFLAIFHKDPPHEALWKIVERSENCTQWAV